MNFQHDTQSPKPASELSGQFKAGFHAVAAWTVELSWLKFSLFFILMMIAGGILGSFLPDWNNSGWLPRLFFFLMVVLFGMKTMMGGTVRAEARATAANEAAQRETLKRQVSEAKMQMMQAQVEPHFLFNTLASVEHLIETDPARAAAMQKRLIEYLRAVLPQIRDNAAVTNLGREVGIVRAYLDLLKMRMEERLQVALDVPDGLSSAAFPPMMLQSLVENAIKHGLECKPEGGTLSIKAEVAHNKLRVSVTDDGMGFGVVPSDSTGLGLQSIRERLALLHGMQTQLIIAPNVPSGVCATIEVPYQLAQPVNTGAAV